jgi:hypothetical protein
MSSLSALPPMSSSAAASTSTVCCASCYLVLKDPHVACQVCNVKGNALKICTDCFAKGREFGEHRSYHSYTLVKSDFRCVVVDQEPLKLQEVLE